MYRVYGTEGKAAACGAKILYGNLSLPIKLPANAVRNKQRMAPVLGLLYLCSNPEEAL